MIMIKSCSTTCFIMLSYHHMFMVNHVRTPLKDGDVSKEKAEPVEPQKEP